MNKEDKVDKVDKVYVLHLRLQQLALALKSLGAILLGAELVSKPWIRLISKNLNSRIGRWQKYLAASIMAL